MVRKITRHIPPHCDIPLQVTVYSKWQHADRAVHTRKLDLGTQGGCKNTRARMRTVKREGNLMGSTAPGLRWSARRLCNRMQVDPVRSGWCDCTSETMRTEWGKAGGGEGCEAGAADLCGATSSEQLVVLSR